MWCELCRQSLKFLDTEKASLFDAACRAYDHHFLFWHLAGRSCGDRLVPVECR